MTITLESIKAEHSKLAEMIAAFEAQARTTYVFPEAEIQLSNGEHYAGIIIGKDGLPSHHLILLPGEAEKVKWQEAKDWAKASGGELPTRREQSLLYANLKEQFKEAWYWSSEQPVSDSDGAWDQDFVGGGQNYGSTDNQFRARAVRRLVIE